MRLVLCVALLFAFSARAELLLHKDDDGLEVSAALDAASLFSRQNNAFYIDAPKDKRRNRDFTFMEYLVHPQLYASYGGFYAGFSVIGAGALGDGEPYEWDVENEKRGNPDPKHVDLEQAYVGWKNRTVDISAGAQLFEVADGLLIADGNGDSGKDGATWLAPRNAFSNTAIARFNMGAVNPTAFYLRYHENMESSELVGLDLSFVDEALGKANIYGFKVFDSSGAGSRKGLNVYATSYRGSPIGGAEKLELAGGYVLQRNNDVGRKKRARGWYAEAGYDFEVVKAFLRRSQFSGDKASTENRDESFDSFMPGASDFGAWFPGEIVGQQYSLNSDLRIWTLGLRRDIDLLEGVSLGANLYRFDYDVKKQATNRSADRHLGDEVDIFASIQANENLSFTPIAAFLRPGKGAKNAHGEESKTSTLLALIAWVSF